MKLQIDRKIPSKNSFKKKRKTMLPSDNYILMKS